MGKILIVLTAFLISSAGLQTFAQEKTQTPPTEIQGTGESTKSSVDKMVDEARKRGEVVLDACLMGDVCDPNLEVVRALELPQPDYPPIARAAHATGEVRVQVLIDVDGTVIAAAAIGGHPLLQAAGVKAARQAKFSVPKQNGEPVKMTGVIKYAFVME
jgi:TonB family protein